MMTDGPTLTTKTTVRTETLIKATPMIIRSAQNATVYTRHKVNAMPMGPCALMSIEKLQADLAQMTASMIVEYYIKHSEAYADTTAKDLLLMPRNESPSLSEYDHKEGLFLTETSDGIQAITFPPFADV